MLKQLARFDDKAGLALAVVERFHAIASEPQWDESDIVRTMATMADCPARLLLAHDGVYLCATSDGQVSHTEEAPHPGWTSERIVAGEPASLWIERVGPMSLVDAAVMSCAVDLLRTFRFSARIPAVSDSRGHLASIVECTDPELLPVLLRRAGLTPESRVLAVARPGMEISAQLVHPGAGSGRPHPDEDRRHFGVGRVGLGLEVEASRLAESWASATSVGFCLRGLRS